MISRIPILMPSKSPIAKWKEYQNRVLSDAELNFLLDHHRTRSIAQVCGRVSGNLEVIDIDEKHQPGISAAYLTAIRSVLPDLFFRLHIVKTPSGGHHIKYFCPDISIPGNQKLAYAEGAKEACIETRGEGGYVVAPPTEGYTHTNQTPIPTITESERAGLFAIAASFNTRVRAAKNSTPKTRRRQNNFDLTPWDAFNESQEGESMLEQHGWKFDKETAHHIYYIRPGKDKGISASFVKKKRMFYIFTSSTELEPSRGYSPYSLLVTLNYRGDHKEAYRYLIANGFGRMKPEAAEKAATYAIQAGKEIPATLPEEIKQKAIREVEERAEKYPFGTFWKPKDGGGYRINYQSILNVMRDLGLRRYKDTTYQIDGIWLKEISHGDFISTVKAYIKEEEEEVYNEICHEYEGMMKDKAQYFQERLESIDPAQIERDTRRTARKFYRNGVVEVTADGWKLIPYYQFKSGLVFRSRFLDRDFVYKPEEGLFIRFLEAATDYVFTEQRDRIKKIMGYLAHDYKDSTTGYLIALTEMVADPKDGGGTGKSLLCGLLKHMTTYVNKNASQEKDYASSFFQVWKGERVMAISDAPADFQYSFLKEPITGEFTYKRLYKNEVTIPVEEGPKFIVQTNFGIDKMDGGLKRRTVHLEFTDFFTRAGGVDKHFGKHFPNDWVEVDWAGYDSLFVDGLVLWLRDLKLDVGVLSEGGEEKLFKQKYGVVVDGLVKDIWEALVKMVRVPTDRFNNLCEDYYRENQVGHRPSVNKINQALEDYAARMGYTYQKNVVDWQFGRVRVFNKVGQ